MAESASSSVDSLDESLAEPTNDVLVETLSDALVDSESLSSSDLLNEVGINKSHFRTKQTIDSRRRLEERLAERYLAKDMQEFDFDL